MRVFLMLLIFAIGFSGYSAAVHAFGHGSCDPAMMMQTADDNSAAHASMDMPDCPEHRAHQDQQKDAGVYKTASKDKCIDCTHCCASNAMSLPDYGGASFLPQASILAPTSVDQSVGDFLYSLKRPPKSLV